MLRSENLILVIELISISMICAPGASDEQTQCGFQIFQSLRVLGFLEPVTSEKFSQSVDCKTKHTHGNQISQARRFLISSTRLSSVLNLA
jgi:hypothetical protein